MHTREIIRWPFLIPMVSTVGEYWLVLHSVALSVSLDAQWLVPLAARWSPPESAQSEAPLQGLVHAVEPA